MDLCLPKNPSHYVFSEVRSSLVWNSQSSSLSFLSIGLTAQTNTHTYLCLFPETENLNHLPLPLSKGHGYSKNYLELRSVFFLFPLFLAVLEINLECVCGRQANLKG